MLAAEPRYLPSAFAMDQRQAARTVELAVRSSAVVTLTPRADEGLQLSGCIERDTGESLWISIDPSERTAQNSLQSACCDGVLELGDARYLFDTHILASCGDKECVSMEIARPRNLRVVQRRRFWRANLRGSSSVRLFRHEPNGDAGHSPWSCDVDLMNVSVDGLACRAARRKADEIRVGEVVLVDLSLSGDGDRFSIDAVVKSKIPAGTEGRMVVGLQFKYPPGDALAGRLQSALERLT